MVVVEGGTGYRHLRGLRMHHQLFASLTADDALPPKGIAKKSKQQKKKKKKKKKSFCLRED